jgi:carbamoyl-phosphate synthase large subunit
MSEICNVLVSSAGRRVALMDAFRTSLGRLGVSGSIVASDMSELAPAMHLADDAFIVPPCTSDEFIPEMLAICEQEGISLVIPTIDTELPMLAAAKDEFAQVGVTVAISGTETVAIGADKHRTHDWLTERGFPTVDQQPLSAVEADGLSYPVLAKPARGSASKGVHVVESPEALAAVTGDDMVIQTVAPGLEYTTDTYVDRAGDVRMTVPRQRLEVRAGEVSKGRTGHHEQLEATVAAIAGRLPDAYGALNIQAFVHGADVTVIEINPRFGGGFPLSYEAGADLPGWLISEHLGRPLSIGDWQPGVVMLRYDEAVFFVPGGDR